MRLSARVRGTAAENHRNPDDDAFWERNEYEALKTMFLGAAYYEAAQGDPEIYGRYQADGARLAALHAKLESGKNWAVSRRAATSL